jgi:hypothetical protein
MREMPSQLVADALAVRSPHPGAVSVGARDRAHPAVARAWS